MSNQHEYLPTIGLEIHVQLRTASKLFSPEATSYGQPPNTATSNITLAHPGTMPSAPNKKAIEHVIKLGLSCHATITRYNHFARKNYFYPDLPKGYQITQDKTPLCKGGYITIHAPEAMKIPFTRMHIEEDTAKSLHGMVAGHTLLDFNRAGYPLCEAVTAPHMHTAEQAGAFVTAFRQRVRYLDISDGDMEKGSLRCDVNVSVAKRGSGKLGQKVELKNLNSIGDLKKAIDYEITRQVALLAYGATIKPATRCYNTERGVTLHMRDKESLSEYRYFPEPDLCPIVIDDAWLQKIQASIPMLPEQLHEKFTKMYKLSAYQSQNLLQNKNTALYYEATCQNTQHYKAAANWVMGPIKSYLNQEKININHLPLTPIYLAKLIELVEGDLMSFSAASTKLFPLLIKEASKEPYQVAVAHGLLQASNHETLENWVKQILTKYPEKVAAYKSGKKGLLAFFMGEVMKLSKGKANPQKTMVILKKLI